MDCYENQSSRPLPLEVWKHILDHLSGKYADLMRCRLVNTDWKKLIDEILKSEVPTSLWKPEFQHDFAQYVKGISGTRLSTAVQVTTFTSEHQQRSQNPFPNGTLIFYPSLRSTEELNEFYCSFDKIASTFSEDIITLIYEFKEADPNQEEKGLSFLLQLIKICKLKNLQNLILYKERWSLPRELQCSELFQDLIEMRNFPVFSKLSQLQIFPLDQACKGLNVWVNFLSFMNPVLSTLNQISLCGNLGPVASCTDYDSEEEGEHTSQQAQDPAKMKVVLESHLPNLKKLKISHPNKSVMDLLSFPCGANSVPKLREVSISFMFSKYQIKPRPFERSVPKIIASLDNQHESLELLHLEIDDIYLAKNPNPILYSSLNLSVKYEKLKIFIVRYYTVIQWLRLMLELREKFVNLNEVKLLVYNDDVEGISPKEFYLEIEKMWDVFPESLQIIQVPYFAWCVKKGECFKFD